MQFQDNDLSLEYLVPADESILAMRQYSSIKPNEIRSGSFQGIKTSLYLDVIQTSFDEARDWFDNQVLYRKT
jgi:hypothetical protein